MIWELAVWGLKVNWHSEISKEWKELKRSSFCYITFSHDF